MSPAKRTGSSLTMTLLVRGARSLALCVSTVPRVKKRTLWYRLRRPTWIGVLTGRWACMPTTRMRNGTDEPAGNSERHHDRGLPRLRSNRSRGRLTDHHGHAFTAWPFLLRGRHG